MIAVSPFSTGGHISHVYGEHSSFVKFAERNWMLNTTLSSRSRDNLPNPIQGGDRGEDSRRDGDHQDGDHSYVPRNMPAIGDLFDLFDFDGHHDH
jgi:phospholipase C